MIETWELAYYNPYRATLYYRELSFYEWQQRMKELEHLWTTRKKKEMDYD